MAIWLEPPPGTVIDEIVKQAMTTCRSRGLDAEGTILELVHLLVAELNGQLADRYRRSRPPPLTKAEKVLARARKWGHANGLSQR